MSNETREPITVRPWSMNLWYQTIPGAPVGWGSEGTQCFESVEAFMGPDERFYITETDVRRMLTLAHNWPNNLWGINYHAMDMRLQEAKERREKEPTEDWETVTQRWRIEKAIGVLEKIRQQCIQYANSANPAATLRGIEVYAEETLKEIGRTPEPPAPTEDIPDTPAE